MLQRKKKKNNFPKAFSLVEAMLVVFIAGMIFVTFYSVFSYGVKSIMESKNRLAAAALANEKMEIVRNLDYDNIGTKKLNSNGTYSYGIPAGDILENETINVNTREFYVHTFVQYVDDSYDGKEGGSPNDSVPNDYKRVRIEVAWDQNSETNRSVFLVATFIPQGVETDSGGGTFSINIINNEGNGIPQATVHITNTEESIDETVTTDDLGNVTLVGAPASNQKYSLEVSKSGYYSVMTYPPYPDSTFNPYDVHASVVSDTLNVKSMKTDKLSQIILNTKDLMGNLIPSVQFNLEGGRKRGEDLSVPPVVIYDFDEDLTSDSDGKKTISNASFGMYWFTLLDTSEYEFVKLTANQPENNVIDLPPDTQLELDALLADKDFNSVLVSVLDSTNDDAPIAGASVELKKESDGFDMTVETDMYGQAFFPSSGSQLTSGTYEIIVKATGYVDKTETVDVDSFEKKEVKLTK